MTPVTKHTPGPWIVSTSVSGNTCITTEDFSIVATVEWAGIKTETYEMVKANAAVLAAAPELLAVIKKLYQFEMIEYGENFEYADPCVKEAGALLERLGELPETFL